MEIEHNPKADVMYIRLNDKPFHKNQVLANGLVVVDLAADGMVNLDRTDFTLALRR